MDLMCVFVILFSLFIVLIESSEPGVLLNIYERGSDGLGNSKVRFQSSDGINREENVQIVNKNVKNEHVVITGYYYYDSPDGYHIRVDYVADENGYRPKISKVERGVVIDNRFPSSAIATLQGGGIG